MLRTRMLTPGFKLFFGLSAFLYAGTILFGISTQLQIPDTSVSDNVTKNGLIQTVTGPLTLGWKGSVGDHVGFAVLVTGAAVAAFLAFVLIAFRDADPEAEAEAINVDSVPLTKAPSGANYSPIVSAFALGIMALGWVINTTILYAGVALLVATMATWTVRAWAERATGDDEVNFQIYHRVIDPIRVPVLGALAIVFVVGGLSRLILAAPNATASGVIFGGAALIFFGAVIIIFLVPKLAKPLAVTFLVIGGLAILGVGIYGIAKGERPVEHESNGATEGGLAPVGGGLH